MFENIDFVGHLETIAGGLTRFIPWIFPVVLAYVGYHVAMAVYQLVKDNEVVGETSEWVVIMSGGEQISAAKGLMCYKKPWETVAKFSSQVKEVSFNAMQCTVEMQGLDVEATLAWTIYNVGDGPMRCYNEHGADLKNQNPVKTNDKIKTLAQAVIRDVIANNKIDVVLKDRDVITTAVQAKLEPILTTWGMWLERIDIKDVKICSGELFRDLQAEQKEKKQLDATIKREETANELAKATMINQLQDKQRYVKQEQAKTEDRIKLETSEVKRNKDDFLKQCDITKRTHLRELKDTLFRKGQDSKQNLEAVDRNYALYETKQDSKLTLERANGEKYTQANEIALKKAEQQYDLLRTEDQAARNRKTAKYDVIKSIYSDPKLLKMEYLRAQKAIYQGRSGETKIHQLDGKDPYATQLSSFIDSAMKN